MLHSLLSHLTQSRHLSRLVLVMLFAVSPLAQGQTVLPAGVQRVVDGYSLPGDSYSFYVQEAGAASAPLLAVNADTPFNPASIAKVVTTLTALEVLGPNYRWYTDVYRVGPVSNGVLDGDLLIRGSGDPFLVEERLRSLLKTLQREGVRHITGDLVLDDSYFHDSVMNGGPIDDQTGRAYNTLPYAVMTNFQAVNFYFRPHPDGQNVIIQPDPDLPNLRIVNLLQLSSGRCRGYQRGIRFRNNPDDPAEVIFDGSFPAACRQYRLLREVQDAPGYTFGLFKQLWGELGGQIDGDVRTGSLQDAGRRILRWSSPPMSEVIRSVNKYSNNLMTRHLLLTLGAEELESPATPEKGVEVVNEYLSDLGLDTSDLVLDNGSGLSRDTRITASLMNDVLQHAWRSPYMPEFVASLPLNGIDGTMRNRLRGRNIVGRMHVKTGSLNDVAAVAGFVYAQSGRTFLVSGMLNYDQADRGPGTELLDALLQWTYEQ